MPPDARDVGEDPYSQHDDDGRRELTTDTELVAEEHDERSDQHIGDEGDDEDLVVEDPLHRRSYPTEDRVQGSDDGDGQIRLQPDRDVDVEQQPDHDSGEQTENRNHVADPRTLACRTDTGTPGRSSESTLRPQYCTPYSSADARSH